MKEEKSEQIPQKYKKKRQYYEQLYGNKFDNLQEMDFLEIYSTPKLNEEEIDNLNRPITRNDIESGIRGGKKNNSHLLTNKILGPDVSSLEDSTKHTKKKLHQSLYTDEMSLYADEMSLYADEIIYIEKTLKTPHKNYQNS